MRMVFLWPMVFFLACQSAENQPVDSTQADESSFETFYQQFHADSAYQMDHIAFPLEGIPPHAEEMSDLSSFRWQREHWVLHRNMNDSLTGYDRQLSHFGDDIVIEKIVQRDTDIGMVRRFAKIGDDWMLIYYAAMNPLPEESH